MEDGTLTTWKATGQNMDDLVQSNGDVLDLDGVRVSEGANDVSPELHQPYPPGGGRNLITLDHGDSR
jgi:hypothetical protein